MYGKIDENGKFIPASVKASNVDGKIVVESMTKEELAAENFKEVYRADGEGRPVPDKQPQRTYEDKGDFILERLNWVDNEQKVD